MVHSERFVYISQNLPLKKREIVLTSKVAINTDPPVHKFLKANFCDSSIKDPLAFDVPWETNVLSGGKFPDQNLMFSTVEWVSCKQITS